MGIPFFSETQKKWRYVWYGNRYGRYPLSSSNKRSRFVLSIIVGNPWKILYNEDPLGILRRSFMIFICDVHHPNFAHIRWSCASSKMKHQPSKLAIMDASSKLKIHSYKPYCHTFSVLTCVNQFWPWALLAFCDSNRWLWSTPVLFGEKSWGWTSWNRSPGLQRCDGAINSRSVTKSLVVTDMFDLGLNYCWYISAYVYICVCVVWNVSVYM